MVICSQCFSLLRFNIYTHIHIYIFFIFFFRYTFFWFLESSSRDPERFGDGEGNVKKVYAVEKGFSVTSSSVLIMHAGTRFARRERTIVVSPPFSSERPSLPIFPFFLFFFFSSLTLLFIYEGTKVWFTRYLAQIKRNFLPAWAFSCDGNTPPQQNDERRCFSLLPSSFFSFFLSFFSFLNLVHGKRSLYGSFV